MVVVRLARDQAGGGSGYGHVRSDNALAGGKPKSILHLEYLSACRFAGTNLV